jgi:multidrug efflux pump subunit AcrA (membrane-fusion protein)
MTPNVSRGQIDAFAIALRQLDQWRRFSGEPAHFWPGLLEAMASLAGARAAALLHRSVTDASAWRRMVVWPVNPARDLPMQEFARVLDELAITATQQEFIVRRLEPGEGTTPANYAVSLRLEYEPDAGTFVAAFRLAAVTEAQAAAIAKLLRLLRDTPAVYRMQCVARESSTTLSQFNSVLDLMALLNGQQHFMAVAMTLCNELASRHHCDRVSLGWVDGDYLRLQAISHTEKFERKMEAVRELEQCMEESFDQGEIVTWPPVEGVPRVSRDHARYAESQRVGYLCSVPLRLGPDMQGVITCERNDQPFPEEEQRLLALCAEMTVRRLSELKRHDRWIGARAATAVREALAGLVGVRHTWMKVTAVLVAVGLAVLFFGQMTYRVEATFIVRTDKVSVLVAPFEGYIEDVPVRIGDPVESNAVLLKLDISDLRLQEAAAIAELDRYTREAEKARAGGSLADMRIASAQADQAGARLGLIRYRLKQSAITAPFKGVVVSGDLRQRISSPVKEGEVLFKVARTDQMYVECRVPQADIHEIGDTATGEIAFSSQPAAKFPIRVSQIEPAAEAKDQENAFVVRCHFDGAIEPWWRPGMSGVAKINVGRRTFFWILTHRTADFLRMYFWL